MTERYDRLKDKLREAVDKAVTFLALGVPIMQLESDDETVRVTVEGVSPVRIDLGVIERCDVDRLFSVFVAHFQRRPRNGGRP